MIDPRRLQLLAEVASTGTVTAAAESLGYTPSAVSQQLRRLGTEVGTPVLEPRGRNVVLTAAGRALVEAAPDVLGALERAETAARAALGRQGGPVRLGGLASTFVDLVPRAMAMLSTDHPTIDLRVTQLGDELLGELRDRHIDMAVEHHWSNIAPRDLAGLHVEEVLVEPVYVAAPAGLDLTSRTVLGAQPWIDHPCDQCGPAARSIVIALGGDVARRPFLTDDMTVMLHVVALGSALSVLPGLGCLHPPPGVALWRVPGVVRRIGAFVRETTRDDPTLTTVAEHLGLAGQILEARFAELDTVGDLPADVSPITVDGV